MTPKVEFVGGFLDGETVSVPGKPEKVRKVRHVYGLDPEHPPYFSVYERRTGTHGVPFHWIHSAYLVGRRSEDKFPEPGQ